MKLKKARAKAKPKIAKKAKIRKAVKSKAKPKKASSKRPPAAKAKKKAPKVVAESIPRKGIIAPVGGVLLGYVEDYFAKIGVIALTLQAPLSVGAKIQVLGHTTNIEQGVGSMQIDHIPVTQAAAKSGVGIKVTGRARTGDHVYLLK